MAERTTNFCQECTAPTFICQHIRAELAAAQARIAELEGELDVAKDTARIAASQRDVFMQVKEDVEVERDAARKDVAGLVDCRNTDGIVVLGAQCEHGKTSPTCLFHMWEALPAARKKLDELQRFHEESLRGERKKGQLRAQELDAARCQLEAVRKALRMVDAFGLSAEIQRILEGGNND